MAQNIVEILIKLKDDTASGLKAVQSGLSGLENAANTVSGAVFNLRNSIAGIAIGAGLTQVITQFSAFDDSMRAAGTIAGATGQEFKKMTDLALKMGIDTKFKASEAADAMVKLGYSSFKAGEQIAALPSILDMAAAGGISLADSAGIASTVIRAFNMDASESGHVADVITKAFTSTSTTMGELGEAWKYVAPIAAGVGASFEELIGTLGILSNAGIKGSMGGTTLRITLDTLLNPTKDEAEQMKALGDRIGGAGLQIKDSQGNFLGFANIVRQLEDAGMRADEALKLFGARGGPGMAALLSQGSDAIANMSTQLENADGTAKKIATDMTAGLGGSIVFLKSSIESFFLSLGSGLDAPFKQFIYDITNDLNNLIYAIKAAKDDGSLEKWMKVGVDALRSFYETMKSAAEGVWSFIQSNSGLVESLIKLAPTIVTVATAAAGLSAAIGTVKGVFAVAGLAVAPFMSMISGVGTAVTAMGYSLMASFPTFAAFGAAIGTGTTALAGLKAALISFAAQAGIALAAIYGLYKIGEFGVEAVKAWNAMKEGEARLKSFNAEMDSTLTELDKFKNIEVPKDLTGQSLESLQALHGEVRKGVEYWATYIAKMRATGQDSGKDFQNAVSELARLREEADRVKQAINGYATRYRDEFKAAEAAYREHVETIKGVADGRVKYETDAMYKAIDAEAAAYKKGEISYEEFGARKKAITEKSENEINAIKLKAAEQIMAKFPEQLAATEAFNEKEIANAQKAYDQKIKLLDEELKAGTKNAGEVAIAKQKAAGELEKVEKDSAERINKLRTTIGDAAVKEIERIQREQVKKYAEGLKEEERLAKDGMKSKMDAIKLAEDQGKISHSEAMKGRIQVETEYYRNSLQKANENFEKAKNSYKVDSDQFKLALEAKKKAADDLYAKQKEIADKVKQLQDDERMRSMSADDQMRAMQQQGMSEYEAYQDKLAQIAEKGAAAKQAELTDAKLAAELYKQQQSLIQGLDTTIEGHVNKQQGASTKIQLFLEAENNLRKLNQGEIKKQADELTGLQKISPSLNVKMDTVEVKNGVATVKSEMAQITKPANIPVKVEYDPATLKNMQDELKSLTQTAAIIQAKIDTTQPGPELDKLKQRLSDVNTQAGTLQAKLNADQPKQEIAQTEAAAKQAQGTISTPTTMPVETSDAQKNVGSVGMSADDIRKKIEAGTKMTVDTSQPEQALDKVEQKTDAIDKEPVSVDVQVKSQGIEETQNAIGGIPDTKETVNQIKQEGLDEAVSALQKLPPVIETKHVVKSTMEASSAKPTTEKVDELDKKFKDLSKTIETPVKQKVKSEGDNGQALSEYMKYNSDVYADFKDKIERERTTGRLTIEGERGSFETSIAFVENAYGAMIDELSSGSKEYSEEWAAAMQQNADAAQKMADQIIGDGEKLIGELASSIKDTESNIADLDEQITDAAQNYADIGKEISEIDDQISANTEETAAKLEELMSETSAKIAEITAASVTSIGEISIKTADTVRSISQQLMTDEEKYADNKLAVEKALSDAKQALAQGDFEYAKKLTEQANEIAKTMASGSMAENKKAVEEATALLQQSGEIAADVERSIRQEKIAAAQEEAAAKKAQIEEEAAAKQQELEMKKAELLAKQEEAAAQKEALATQKEALVQNKAMQEAQLAATEKTVDAIKNLAKTFADDFATAMDSVNQKVTETKDKIAEPVDMEINIDPAKAALQELQENAYNAAKDSYKMMYANLQSASDSNSYYAKQAAGVWKEQADSAMSAMNRYKELADRTNNQKINTKFTGEASPQLPLTETINNISGAMDDFSLRLKDQTMNVKVDGLDKVKNDYQQTISGMQSANKQGGIADMLNQISSGGGAGLGSAQQAWSQKYGAEKSMELSNLVSQAIAPAINKMAFPDVGGGATVDVSKMFEGVKDLGKTELQIGGKAYPVTAQQDVIKIMQDELRRMKMTGAMR